MRELAIIILNYNTYEMTLNLVKSLEKKASKEIFEIIVVDNASPNESAQKIKEAAEKSNAFIFLRSSSNDGFAAGNNIGLRYAQKKGFLYSLVINNDIEIDSFHQIEKMIELMRINARVGAVSPRIVGKDGKKDPPIYFSKPNFWNLSFGVVVNYKRRYEFDENRNVQIYAPRGSCMLLRNNMLEKIGFLDEKTFLYYEEPILAERLAGIDGECWLCGDSCVVHNHAVTISKSINKKRIIDYVLKSYSYYLREYRKFNFIKIHICLAIRKAAIMLRR